MTREKKKMKKGLIIGLLIPAFLLVAFLVISTLSGDIAWNTSNLFFEEIEGGYSVEGRGFFFFQFAKTATIPETYKGKPVISIGQGAFYGCTNLVSITIPDSVTTIDSSAFYGCTNLASITIGDSVSEIGSRAFYGCTNLASITIPDSVTSIGNSAFKNCNSLTYNEYDEAYYLGNVANPYVLLVKAKSTLITTCEIHKDTKFIDYGAFEGCNNLESITLPFVGASKDGASNINFDYIFGSVPPSLKTVVITSDTSIGKYAFEDCDSLTSITIPDSVTSIGESAFKNCNSLTSITIGNGVTSIGEWAFSGCSSLNYNKYDNAYYLGNENNPYVVLMKANSADITSCAIHKSTRFIYGSAFRGCSSLTSITIPDSVTGIGTGAFERCASLTSITIPEGVTSIGERAFEDCNSLTSITIPYSVTSIGESAFKSCDSLTSITIPDSVTSIGKNAFLLCWNLIQVEDGVGYVDKWVVGLGSSVVTPALRDDTVGIADEAFWYCKSLTSITIPASVTSIGENVFSGCSSLTSIIFEGTMEQWNAIKKYSSTRTVYCTDGIIR